MRVPRNGRVTRPGGTRRTTTPARLRSGHARGFSLIELMVALAIVGILTAIALPSYRRYVLQGNRTDAIKALAFYQQALERCYSQNFTYLGCEQTMNLPANTTDGYYTISFSMVTPPTATSYTLMATVATGSLQAADTQCNAFQVMQTGAQSAQDSSGNDQTQACWGGH